MEKDESGLRMRALRAGISPKECYVLHRHRAVIGFKDEIEDEYRSFLLELTVLAELILPILKIGSNFLFLRAHFFLLYV